MKRLSSIRHIIILVCAFMISCMAIGAEEAHGDSIEWLNRDYDYGMIAERDGKAESLFRFVNKGSEPVSVLSVKPTCGCTASDYPRRPIEVGDTAVIRLVFNPEGRPGKFHKEAKVRLSSTKETLLLHITGNVIGESETLNKLYPYTCGTLKLKQALFPLGTVKKGEVRTLVLTALNQSIDSIDVTLEDKPNYIKAICVPGKIGANDALAITIFYYSSSSPHWGYHEDKLTLKVREHKTGEVTTLPVEIFATLTENFDNMTKEQLQNAPHAVLWQETLDLGTIRKAQSDKPIVKELTVENRGTNPLRIHTMTTVHPALTIKGFTPEMELKKAQKQTFKVNIDPSKISEINLLDTNIRLLTNDPAASTLEVRVVGEIKP